MTIVIVSYCGFSFANSAVQYRRYKDSGVYQIVHGKADQAVEKNDSQSKSSEQVEQKSSKDNQEEENSEGQDKFFGKHSEHETDK